MKLNTSLLQAITLGIAVTTLSAATTSCEKVEREQASDSRQATDADKPQNTDPCPMCGMG